MQTYKKVAFFLKTHKQDLTGPKENIMPITTPCVLTANFQDLNVDAYNIFYKSALRNKEALNRFYTLSSVCSS